MNSWHFKEDLYSKNEVINQSRKIPGYIYYKGNLHNSHSLCVFLVLWNRNNWQRILINYPVSYKRLMQRLVYACEHSYDISPSLLNFTQEVFLWRNIHEPFYNVFPFSPLQFILRDKPNQSSMIFRPVFLTVFLESNCHKMLSNTQLHYALGIIIWLAKNVIETRI